MFGIRNNTYKRNRLKYDQGHMTRPIDHFRIYTWHYVIVVTIFIVFISELSFTE
jgi:hypothetical protein